MMAESSTLKKKKKKSMQISLTSSCDFWCLFERAWATFFWKELEELAFVYEL